MQIVVSCQKPTELELRLSEGVIFKQIRGDQLNEYNLNKEIKGKVAVIEFWGPYCGPCIKNMQELRSLHKKYPNDLEVICVSDKSFDACKKFIKKDRFPFVFLHDEKNQLSKTFPHVGIPYSIVIDQNGKIQEENVSSQITLNLIEELILSNSSVKASKPVSIEEKSPLISFELLRHDNSEIGHSTISTICRRPFITEVDTITEIIQKSELTGYNIIQLYQYAYDVTSSQIEIKDNISFINSTKHKDLYDLNFSCSNMYGDFQEKLTILLNVTFGLSTRIIKKEMTYYELVEINVIPDTIEILNDLNFKQRGTNATGRSTFIAKGNYSVKQMTNLIESFTKERFDKKAIPQNYPVFTRLEGDYALNISITDAFGNQKTWINHFERNGLKLLKKHEELEFIEISKQQ